MRARINVKFRFHLTSKPWLGLRFGCALLIASAPALWSPLVVPGQGPHPPVWLAWGSPPVSRLNQLSVGETHGGHELGGKVSLFVWYLWKDKCAQHFSAGKGVPCIFGTWSSWVVVFFGGCSAASLVVNQPISTQLIYIFMSIPGIERRIPLVLF